ncbi:MAG TPA: ATPase, partial [Planctomycetota bacterium]|nr:ATPase [Planctomycetota bacterium]
HTVILYIRATEADVHRLEERAIRSPKPLFYREEFLDRELENYMRERGIEYVALIDPDDFTRWIFPKLLAERLPRYEAIAREHGFTVSSEDVARIESEEDFLTLVESALERGH